MCADQTSYNNFSVVTVESILMKQLYQQMYRCVIISPLQSTGCASVGCVVASG